MGYEDLRREVLAECNRVRSLGKGLLVSRGVAAWMRAWPEVSPAREGREGSRCGTTGPLPVTVRGEIVLILARMALGAR